MGRYINKGNEAFRQVRNSEYIDKSGLIAVVNNTLFTRQKLSCVTRSRRFGKSMAAEMLAAYYDHSCDSRPLFADLEIAGDPTFEQHLNKYPVIYVDMTAFTAGGDDENVVGNIQKELIEDIAKAYPQVEYHEGDHLMKFLQDISAATGKKFVMIIDEWDAVIRIYSDNRQVKDDFVNLLRRMFKDISAVDVFAGVYMTGILPIKKYKTESALNNFIEYSMVRPILMSRYFGFTKDEVQKLSDKHQMDFSELEKWYDGYQIGDEPSIFNPNSVMQAIYSRMCVSYWSGTGTFEAVKGYINRNFNGLRDNIIAMLAGERSKVDPTSFQNDLSEIHSRDEVLTVLIHLGYLAYNWRENECYIPNREVGGEMVNAVKANRWKHVSDALEQSDQLLKATLEGDAKAVARMVETAHSENTSILSYYNENSMACVLSIAYYAAHADYIFHRELPTGKGFADLVLLPRKNVTKPALVLELKCNRSAKAAISQIRKKEYTEKVAEYSGEMLLVGISYNKKTKRHDCRIERCVKP